MGWGDAGSACAYGSIGCDGTHCCVMQGNVPAPPPSPTLPPPCLPPSPAAPSPPLPPSIPPIPPQIDLSTFPDPGLIWPDGGQCRLVSLSTMLDITANQQAQDSVQIVYISLAVTDGASLTFDLQLIPTDFRSALRIPSAGAASWLSGSLRDLMNLFTSIRLLFCPACMLDSSNPYPLRFSTQALLHSSMHTHMPVAYASVYVCCISLSQSPLILATGTDQYYKLSATFAAKPTTRTSHWGGGGSSLINAVGFPDSKRGRMVVPLAHVFAANTYRAVLRGVISLAPDISSASSPEDTPEEEEAVCPVAPHCSGTYTCTDAIWNTSTSNGAGTCGAQIAWVQKNFVGFSNRAAACRYVAQHPSTPECAPCNTVDCHDIPEFCKTTCITFAYCATAPDANCFNAPKDCTSCCSYAHCVPPPPPPYYCGVPSCTEDVWNTQVSNDAGTCGTQIKWVQGSIGGYSKRADACRFVALQPSTPECLPCDTSPEAERCGREQTTLSSTITATIQYTTLGVACSRVYSTTASKSGEYAVEVSAPTWYATSKEGAEFQLDVTSTAVDTTSGLDVGDCSTTSCSVPLHGTFVTANTGTYWSFQMVVDGACLSSEDGCVFSYPGLDCHGILVRPRRITFPRPLHTHAYGTHTSRYAHVHTRPHHPLPKPCHADSIQANTVSRGLVLLYLPRAPFEAW